VDLMASVFALARLCGIHCIVSTQSPDASWFGRSARDNLQARIAVGPVSGEVERMMFRRTGVTRGIPESAKGRVTVQIGDGEVSEHQSWWVPTPGQAKTPADVAILERLGLTT